MENGKLSLLAIVAKYYLKNPFFILDKSGEKDLLFHQTETVARCIFLKPTRILLADVIGLGKTITALRIMEMLKIYDRASHILIITPSILLPQWIEELRSFGIVPIIIKREELKRLEKHSKLPPGVYIGSLDRLKREEYFKIVGKEEWDLVIVDEAQKIGFVGGKPTQRFEKIGHLLMKLKNANVLLLSATPHKGYDYDYLARLSLVDPSLITFGPHKAFKAVARRLDASFYGTTHYVILHRRTKSDINETYEDKQVFRNCYMLAILIKPKNYEELMLSNLIKVGEKELAKYYENLAIKGLFDPTKVRAITRLLRKLIMKRGLSSPLSLVKTFSKITLKRSLILDMLEEGIELSEVKEVIEEKIPKFEIKLERLLDPEAEFEEDEEDIEPDVVFNEVADAVGRILPSKFVNLVKDAVKIAQKMIRGEYIDTKLETVKQIIEETFKEQKDRFSDLYKAKVIIFTEFKDTADYIHSKLSDWFMDKFGEKGKEMVKKITSENRDEYERIAKWFRESPYAKVLITTDVLGEGLNLQAANVLINYEVTWSPIRLEQRIGRVWRYGQNKNCYVFNLFYLHKYEKDVADNIFRKLYGIKEAIEKQELTLGDEIYMSAIGDSLFENVVRERLGRGYVEYSRYLSGFIPLSFKYRGREVKLTESEIIERLFEGKLEEYVEEFIRAIIDLAKKIREKNIYPKPLTRDEIERFLEQSFGIRNIDDAKLIATRLSETYEKISKEKLGIFSRKRPDIILKELESKGGMPSDFLVFVLPSTKKLLYVLALARIKVKNQSSQNQERIYEEPILIELDVEKKKADLHRGRRLVEILYNLLPPALEVDEHHGLSGLIDAELSKAKSFVVGRLNSNYEFYTANYNDMLERINRYEDKKVAVGASRYFKCRVSVDDIRPLCYFVSVGLFPESKEAAETGVWFGFESKYLRDIILKYEEEKGRKADIRRREEEHYDVYSYSEDEERFIEVKGFVRPKLEIKFTEKEYETAKELGDKFWLYLVYGVGTGSPVILCIRNPARKLDLIMTETAIVRREYIWSKRLEL